MNPRAYWRFFVVARHFLPLLLAYARDRRRYLLFGGRRRVSPARRRKRARALLDSLLTLGPTFIKLGQLLSTRPDVLPPEYVEEFTKLQDRVPPAPWKGAKGVVEAELGAVDEHFDDFDTEAISGASLGQVYRAEVDGQPVAVKVRRPGVEAELGAVDEHFDDFDTEAISGASLGQVYRAEVDGQPVAVKVRRPGVEALVEADLRVIRWSLPFLLYFVGESRAFSLETLADEFDRVIHQEMDYERERRMLEEIRANFEDDPKILMPAVVGSHSTRRVLTMEYIGGTKITNVEQIDDLGLDRTELATHLQRAYLKMIIGDGIFHADPHPGNLAVKDSGALVFYDFGMSGRVDQFVQEKIVDFYTAVARQDIDAILDALIEMGTLSPEADRDVMADVMELAIADARGEDIEQYRVQQIVGQIEDTMYEFPLRLPPNLALVLRVATVVEGVCVTLDPEFDFIEVATDYLGEQGYFEATAREYVEDRVEEVQQATRAAVRTPPKLENAIERINRGDLVVESRVRDEHDVYRDLATRIVLGVLVAAALLSTTVLYAFATVEAAAVASVLVLVLVGVLYWSFRRPRGIRAKPQFTRQQMRQRRERAEEEE